MDKIVRETDGPLCILGLGCLKLAAPDRAPDKQLFRRGLKIGPLQTPSRKRDNLGDFDKREADIGGREINQLPDLSYNLASPQPNLL
jgi:hypothetical protein